MNNQRYNSSMKKIIIDLLRHGDVAGGKKLLGSTDIPLSDLGWKQMSEKTRVHLPWQKIISSDLSRCSAFSEQLAINNSIPHEIESRFREINFGDWDGLLLSELYSGSESEQLFQFMQSPSSTTPPNGEPYEAFKERVLSSWNELISSLMQSNTEHCVLITHGGVIRAIISEVLSMPDTSLFNLEVPYACLSRITHYEGSPASLSFHNSQL